MKPLFLSDDDIGELRRFIDKIHDSGKKVVMLARGGIAADRLGSHFNDYDVEATIDSLLRLPAAAIVVVGGRSSKVKQAKPRVFQIPNLRFDFSSVLPMVDVLAHHGRC